MGSFSDEIEPQLLSHIFKVATWNSPTNLYVALSNSTLTDTAFGTNLRGEVSGGAYARKKCNTWTTPSANTISNSIKVEYTQATANWGTVKAFAICDHSSTGDVIVYGSLSTAKKIGTNDTAKFATNDIDISLD